MTTGFPKPFGIPLGLEGLDGPRVNLTFFRYGKDTNGGSYGDGVPFNAVFFTIGLNSLNFEVPHNHTTLQHAATRNAMRHPHHTTPHRTAPHHTTPHHTTPHTAPHRTPHHTSSRLALPCQTVAEKMLPDVAGEVRNCLPACSPPTNHQPPTTNQQPPTTNHTPPHTTHHPPPTAHHPPPTINHR